MTFALKIKTRYQDNNWAFVKTFDNHREVQQIRSLCPNRFWGFFAQFIPVRTHNLRDFAQDFFIPAVTQSAVKVDSFFSEKMVMRLLELTVDFTTLCVRAITAIPWVLYNSLYPKAKDPFYQYLKSQGLAEEILELDAVYARFEWVEDVEGKRHQFAKGSSVGFIPLPKLTQFKHYSCKSREIQTT